MQCVKVLFAVLIRLIAAPRSGMPTPLPKPVTTVLVALNGTASIQRALTPQPIYCSQRLHSCSCSTVALLKRRLTVSLHDSPRTRCIAVHVWLLQLYTRLAFKESSKLLRRTAVGASAVPVAVQHRCVCSHAVSAFRSENEKHHTFEGTYIAKFATNMTLQISATGLYTRRSTTSTSYSTQHTAHRMRIQHLPARAPA